MGAFDRQGVEWERRGGGVGGVCGGEECNGGGLGWKLESECWAGAHGGNLPAPRLTQTSWGRLGGVQGCGEERNGSGRRGRGRGRWQRVAVGRGGWWRGGAGLDRVGVSRRRGRSQGTGRVSVPEGGGKHIGGSAAKGCRGKVGAILMGPIVASRGGSI